MFLQIILVNVYIDLLVVEMPKQTLLKSIFTHGLGLIKYKGIVFKSASCTQHSIFILFFDLVLLHTSLLIPATSIL